MDKRLILKDIMKQMIFRAKSDNWGKLIKVFLASHGMTFQDYVERRLKEDMRGMDQIADQLAQSCEQEEQTLTSKE